MAIAWVLRHRAVPSALVGASSPEQLKDTMGCTRNLSFSAVELETIDTILHG